jgi:hypothetical protein
MFSLICFSAWHIHPCILKTNGKTGANMLWIHSSANNTAEGRTHQHQWGPLVAIA